MSEIFETAIVEKRNMLNELKTTLHTTQELRLFSIYLSRINPFDIKTRIVRFPLSEFQQIMNFGKLNIGQLKASASSLLKTQVFLPKENGGFKGINLFEVFDVDQDNFGEWYIDINATNAALPLMFDFKDRYFQYKLWNALRLKAPSQIRMYEILKQYEKIGRREIETDRLQELLSVNYTRWDRFKAKVLDNCQQALQEMTDISYTYERGKTGKGGKWLTVIFFIYPNTPQDKSMLIFGKELELHIYPQTTQVISEKFQLEISQDLQQMICFAGDLTPNEVKEIYYSMQEKGYANIFLSFKRLYQTAVNNDPADLKKYILGIIKNDVLLKPENKTAENPDPDIEKYKVLINKF